MPNPFRLSTKTQFIAYNDQLYTVVEVEKADWKHVPVGAFVFISRSQFGSSYYCERSEGVLIPLVSRESQAGRITENNLCNGASLLLDPDDSQAPNVIMTAYSEKSIFRVYYPIAVTPLPKF